LAGCVKKTLKHTVILSEYKPLLTRQKKSPVATGLFIQRDER